MIYGAVLEGIQAIPVQIEVTDREAPFEVRGLSDAAARETRVRVRASFSAIGRTPRGVVHVARKDGVPIGPGAALDVAIAVAASGLTVPADVLFAGELSLMGEIRGIRGGVPIALLVRNYRIQGVFPAANATLPVPADMLGTRLFAAHLREVLDAIEVANLPSAGGTGEWLLPLPSITPSSAQTTEPLAWSDVEHLPIAADVRKAVESGARVLVFIGPVGSGRTVIARRIASLLPALTEDQRLDVDVIASAAGLPTHGSRPFRAPHHTASTAAIVGGGTPIRPGEVTLAHDGVLLVDEANETPRATIDALVAALKKGETNHTRLAGERTVRTVLPARPAVTVLSITLEKPPHEGHNPAIYAAKRAQDLAARFAKELGAVVIDFPRIEIRDLARHGAAS